jgi:hypothetical protein
MAIGTLTVAANRIKSSSDHLLVDRITLVGDSSYPTGGMTGIEAALQAKTNAANEIIDVRPSGLNGGYVTVWDAANKKLLVLNSGGGAAKDLPTEIDAATNLSGVTFALTIYSK